MGLSTGNRIAPIFLAEQEFPVKTAEKVVGRKEKTITQLTNAYIF